MKEILSNKEKLDILCKIEQRGAAAWKQDFSGILGVVV